MRRKTIAGFILLFLLSTCFIHSVDAQKVDPADHEDPPIKVNTTLLNIPVVVSGTDGRSITGLTKENFIVTKNGQKQEIGFLFSSEDPVHIAIILDASGSTTNVFGRITKAAKEFLTVLRPEDQAMVVSFANNVVLEQGFTADQKRLRNAIDDTYSLDRGGSKMNDAVYRVLTEDFLPVEGRKAILVLTDGDVGGKITGDKLIEELIESDVPVYPVFYYTRRLFPGAKSVSYNQLFTTVPGGYLNSLATATGGRLYAADAGDFAGAFQRVAGDIKNQYVLGVYVDGAEDSKTIKVEVDQAGVVTRSKTIIRAKKKTPPTLRKKL